MKKIRIFGADEFSYANLEENVNLFILLNNVLDIQSSSGVSNDGDMFVTIVVYYEEQEN